MQVDLTPVKHIVGLATHLVELVLALPLKIVPNAKDNSMILKTQLKEQVLVDAMPIVKLVLVLKQTNV